MIERCDGGPEPVPATLGAAAPLGAGIVTAVRDREANLLEALSSWLSVEGLEEIAIVDWSSRRPIADAVSEAGLRDGRLRILRVEAEPRWVLSHAFNLSFRLSRARLICKVDADVVLTADALIRNRPAPGRFVAGDYRKVSDASQHHLNGTFLAHRGDLARVGGVNEFLTAYGYDDTDLYERLLRLGGDRVTLDHATARHLAHDDASRVAFAPTPWSTLREKAERDPAFQEMRNGLLAHALGPWGPDMPMARFRWRNGALRRDGPSLHAPAAEMVAAIDRLALRRYLVVKTPVGDRARVLEDAALDDILDAPMERR